MSNDVNSATSSFVDSLRWPDKKVPTEKNDELKQEDFFALLTQQLSYQDPSKPADNDQMISQMTNFTMAEGISNLNTKFESLAASMTSNSALQASALIGKKALLESDTVEHGPGMQSRGSIIVAEPVEKLTLSIVNDKNELVRKIELGEQSVGATRFEWDGLNQSGDPVPPGEYTIKAEGQTNGKFESLPTATFRNIDSVNVNGSQGIVINTKAGAVRLTDVAEIA
ncbi:MULTISPECIES: flagellar hook assembly protein FlgD [Pseudoalteromonas]|uniref:Basal-body rod modification protein FlgD n=1 Tax=Pseudoalteromonas obscura TaxID=3048491 RepID=A0ABT7ETL7_9GAMM|nr:MULTISPECIES: flagellar hook assembly protein FlgD [Pseudoalteromonas]MBQ4836958.1 flagellar hook assembly protein FlgD [Pseudoalteromonas luteoviolacea]MDK2598399.1 flagellar hook assembly protein FlgD [Pseudoalteromonas sp. P94(2023)]